MNYVLLQIAVAVLVPIVGGCIAWLLYNERRMGQFMTREEHAKMCEERNRATENRIQAMHRDNQAGIQDIKQHLNKQDDEAQRRGETLTEIWKRVAALEESRRINELREGRR